MIGVYTGRVIYIDKALHQNTLLRVCNMIELVHAKLTHTYTTARRLSGMPVGCAMVMLSVFQIC